MNDSDQDFVDLCSKLLKRSRKKGVELKQKRACQHALVHASHEDEKRTEESSRSDCVGAESHEYASSEAGALVENTGKNVHDSADAELASVQTTEQCSKVKDKLPSMTQHLKIAGLPMNLEQGRHLSSPESDCHLRVQDNDEALAMRLQKQLDREAAVVHSLDLAAEGFFLCHICHRGLSHMTPEGRTQHINRCLDNSEHPMAAPLPSLGVPDCPICGKKFKSHKSRSGHLKRCSADMGVSPGDLLQALQRQAEEMQHAATNNTLSQTRGTKRKNVTKAGRTERKKPRKSTELLDEDTLVALALSSSLFEQESEQLLNVAKTETITPDLSVTPILKWRPNPGKKGCGKKKKGPVPRPPPILLIQDADAALTRLQERVSALLLRSRAPSPPTPTRYPSTLSALSGAAPLWQKSALLNGNLTSVMDFFVPELKDFIKPWKSAETLRTSSQRNDNPCTSVQLLSQRPVVSKALSPATCSSTPSNPATEQFPASSQTLQDLVELCDDEMAVAHDDHNAPGPGKDNNTSLSTNLQVSGFFLEKPADLSVNDTPLETTYTDAVDLQSQVGRSLCQPGGPKEHSKHLSGALSTLASSLSSMVNNPQLSDWQLQVDSGQVFFVHSFMIYARCPLLAELMHESGFGVHEEGMPEAQRVLISDIPGQAVLVLLQYLYTAKFSLPASLCSHVLELASRFDLQELRWLCEPPLEEASVQNDDGVATNHMEYLVNGTDNELTALFNSMWSHEDDADQEGDDETGLKKAADATLGDRELHEEQVNEEELDEIYEFAATQRMRDEEKAGVGEIEGDDGVILRKLTESRRSPGRSSEISPDSKCDPLPDHSLERTYNRLFSDYEGVYKEDQPSFCSPSSTPPKAHTSPTAPLKLSGQTLLQSSASLGSDSSPHISNLPLPGVTPYQDSKDGTVDVKEIPTVEQEPLEHRTTRKPQSRVSDSIHVPLLSISPLKGEPDVLVLSDSSEDMEVSVVEPRAQCPVLSRSPTEHSFTYLKPSNASEEKKESRNLGCSVVDLSLSPNQLSQVDCSPELSWLIPPTPLNDTPRKTSVLSSTQTKSSICRTTLFPKESSSPPFSNTSMTDCVSTYDEPVEGSGPWLNPATAKVDTAVCAELKFSSRSMFSHHLHNSSKQERPQKVHVDPHSSTPLQSDVLQHHIRPDTSPLYTGPSKQKSLSQERESLEESQLERFHHSPFCDHSEPHSSTSHKSVPVSERQSKCSSQSPAPSIRHHSTGFKPSRNGTSEDGQTAELADDDIEEVRVITGSPVSSIGQSFLFNHEPPIAFDNSWGINSCDEVGGNPGQFSLRREDSGGWTRPVDASGSGTTSLPRPSCQGGISSCQEPQKQSLSNSHSKKGEMFTPSTPDLITYNPPEISDSLLVANVADNSGGEDEILPLSQRLNPSAQFKTPTSSRNKRHHKLVPITPMPHYSDMDTPELKNELNRFGVRALPKRQMILKLKEIHHYTHQLVSSDSEDEGPCAGPAAQTRGHPSKSTAAVSRPVSSRQKILFKDPKVPSSISPAKHNLEEEEMEPLTNSQDSNASSATSSEESERHNPELCLSSGGDSDSDVGISASQAATNLKDRLQALRRFILSDSDLYTQILQYQPLVLSQLQDRLKAAGIRLGAAKLVNFLDSQCITFTTAKPGKAAPTRRRVKKTGKKAKTAGK
ncbi:structure-specific endonuclease subunit SLX4 isoform X2 [Syngnathoides biaculeatus]|uniref:structure-specific endonuclease subunit SLX4 isoform X2 n=1 Tax=Syngnathoides biaculeatus TaxID=300417 RepID=UPI002ADE384C|nr:structure-specific endonuclease subunit SLX4 isoform X2 [Syngnathoides biaculeatus]